MKKKFKIQVTCRVIALPEPGQFYEDRLEVSEELWAEAGNMLELFSILGRFHELAEKIRKEHAQAPVQ